MYDTNNVCRIYDQLYCFVFFLENKVQLLQILLERKPFAVTSFK